MMEPGAGECHIDDLRVERMPMAVFITEMGLIRALKARRMQTNLGAVEPSRWSRKL